MARQFNGSSQYLYNNSFGPFPASISCWFYVDADGGAETLVNLSELSGSGDDVRLVASMDITNDPLRFISSDGTNENIAVATGTITTGTWHHAWGTIDSNSYTRARFNGGGLGASFVYSRTLTLGNSRIAVRETGSLADYFGGRIAEVAIWNTDIHWDYGIDLANGASPFDIEVNNLAAYWPVWGDASPEPDLISGYDMTLSNAPTQVAHPSARYPVRTMFAAPDLSGIITV